MTTPSDSSRAKRKSAPDAEDDQPHKTVISNDRTALKVPAKQKAAPRKTASRKTAANRSTAPSGPTRLTKRRPVKTEMPTDVWCKIMENMEPLELVMLRQVSPMFRDTLNQYPSVMRTSMENHLGPDLPKTPAWLSEFQYVELMCGKKCMLKGCTAKSRRFDYNWYNGLRSHWSCTEKLGITRGEALVISSEKGNRRLPEFLSRTYGDSKCFTGELNAIIAEWESLSREIEGEIEGISEEQQWTAEERKVKGQEWSDRRKEEWNTQKLTCRNKTAEQCSELHRFRLKIEREERERNKARTNRRKEFFISKVAKMDTSITQERLRHMQCFHSAVHRRKEPTEKCWTELRPKLEKEQEKWIINWFEKARAAPDVYRCGQYYNNARNTHVTPEVVLINKIATEIMEDMEQRIAKLEEQGKCMTAIDFILVCLNEIRMRYEHMPQADKPAGLFETNGAADKYELSFQDFSMVFGDHVLQPARKLWAKQTGRPCKDFPGKVFRLPAYMTLYEEALGMDMRDTSPRRFWNGLRGDIDHARLAYVANRYGRFGSSGCTCEWWSIIPWTRDMPVDLLNAEHTPTFSWIDHNCHEYRHDLFPLKVRSKKSIFEGRTAARGLSNGSRLPEDFVGNIVLAADHLSTTSLDEKLKSVLAFRYALMRYKSEPVDPEEPDGASASSKPPFNLASDIGKTLSSAGHGSLFQGFSCKACENPGDNLGVHINMTNIPRALKDLKAHFKQQAVNWQTEKSGIYKHHKASTWTENMFLFPEESDVLDALANSDAGDASVKFAQMFPMDDSELSRGKKRARDDADDDDAEVQILGSRPKKQIHSKAP